MTSDQDDAMRRFEEDLLAGRVGGYVGPQAGEVGFTWIQGWTGFWVSFGQWLLGDGGLWPWTRKSKQLPKGRPTHVFQVLEDGVIIEAQPGGARVGHTSLYRNRPVLYTSLPLTNEQRAAVSAIALRYEYTPYSFLDYLYLALWRFGIRPDWLRDKVRDSGHMICSQMVDKIQEEIGMNWFTDLRLNQDVSPGEQFALVEQKGWWDTGD